MGLNAPFLAPQARRGKRNEPEFALLTAEVLAKLHGIDVEELVATTTRNAEAFFRFGDQEAGARLR